MSLFTPDELVDGEYAVAAELNAMFTAIASILNGGIVDENFAANAPVVIASTVGGLGATRAGKAGMIRAGASPYDFIGLVYDASLAKWVSSPQRIARVAPWETPVTGPWGTASTSYVGIGATAGYEQGVIIPGFKAIYDADLRPQFRLSGRLESAAATTATLGLKMYEFASDDDSLSSIQAGESPTIAVTGAIQGWDASDWTTPTLSAPAEAHAIVYPRLKTSNGVNAVSLMHFSIDLRWVSA